MMDNYNDEKMPTPDAIEQMNEEYMRVLPMGTCERISAFLHEGYEANHGICMPNFAILSDVISASCWIISALEELSHHTRSHGTKELIETAIEIKKACIQCAIILCNGNNDMPIDKCNDIGRQNQYNMLYYEIRLRECQILRQVARIEDATRLLALENTAMLILETIGR